MPPLKINKLKTVIFKRYVLLIFLLELASNAHGQAEIKKIKGTDNEILDKSFRDDTRMFMFLIFNSVVASNTNLSTEELENQKLTIRLPTTTLLMTMYNLLLKKN